jgi:hypothetical protein
VRFVGVDADRQFDTDKNNFGPRVGLAYSVSPKTIVRAGYGIFYMPYIGSASGAGAGFTGFQSFTPWLSSLDGLTPANYFSNPFPGGLNLPTKSSLGLMTNVGGEFGATTRDGAIVRGARVGYMQQWNINVQRELPGQIVVEAAYAGSKGTKLPFGPRGFQENQLRPELLSLGSALQELVDNPFYGVIKTRGMLSEPKVTRGQLLRPYPHFLGLLNFRPDAASSNYHALQVRVQKQFSKGLTLMAAYTNSKLITDSDNIVSYFGQSPGAQNTYDRRSERSLSGMDVSQRFVFHSTWDLPIGVGKQIGGSWPRWMQMTLGDWSVNGILTLARGVPLAPYAPNTSQSFSDGMRPNALHNAKLPGGRSTDEKLQQWFDTSAFAQPAPFTFGNASRTMPNVRVDGTREIDFSLFKNFPLAEGWRIQFRAESFNLFNTPRFGFPGTTVGQGSFGVVSGQSNSPRQVQFGLKLIF